MEASGKVILTKQPLSSRILAQSYPSLVLQAPRTPLYDQEDEQPEHQGMARAEEPAPTKLDDQHNTHAMPVRALTMWLPRSPLGLGVHR